MKSRTTVELLIERVMDSKQISRDRVQKLNQVMSGRQMSEADWRAYDRLSDAVLEGTIEISC